MPTPSPGRPSFASFHTDLTPKYIKFPWKKKIIVAGKKHPKKNIRSRVRTMN